MKRWALVSLFMLSGCFGFDNVGFEGGIKLGGLISWVADIDIHVKVGAFKYPEGGTDAKRTDDKNDNSDKPWGFL